MTVTHGARTDVMRAVAGDLGRDADHLVGFNEAAAQAVSGMVAAWNGPDAQGFGIHWAAHERVLAACVDHLRTMSIAVGRQADEQARASGTGSLGVLGGLGGLTPGGPQSLGPGGPTPPSNPLPPTDPDFGDEVRGSDGRPVDKDLWKLAWHSYGPDNHLYGHDPFPTEQPPLPPGWQTLTIEELSALGLDPKEFDNDRTGLQSTLYRTDDGKYVLAFRGSDENADWVTDFSQGAGIDEGQYPQAMLLGKAVHDRLGDGVVFTGHSLGGGLAAAAGMATGAAAVTFDAAGVHPFTASHAAAIRGGGASLLSVEAQAAHGQVRTYQMDTDILTNVQEHSLVAPFAPDAPGAHITMASAPSPESAWWSEEGSDVGAKVGFVVGLVTSPLAGPLAPIGDAAIGAAAGFDLGTGAYGHHWHNMDAAMESRYPG